MDDEELIAAAGRGDHTALRTIFERHASWLAGRLRRSLPADAVEDVLQETFVAVWRGAHRYRGGGAPGAWLWGIARRQAALWVRKNHRHDLLPEVDQPMSHGPDPAETATSRADIDAAIGTLGPVDSPERRLARLAFIEDRPTNEIAQELDIPAGTVKSRIFTLRRRLQAMLGGDR